MLDYDQIKRVHLELTERCQAKCIMCPRTDIHTGKMNTLLSNSELGLEEIKKILPVEFLQQLDLIACCGNFGDPAIAKDFLEIHEYFRESNEYIRFSVHTNGGIRSSDDWIRLANILKGKGDVVFGIDGLEDTNHIYRKNVNWNILYENFNAFINAGGNAIWQFIIFKHNEHQVEDAQKLAYQLGFKHFYTVKTNRFVKSGPDALKIFADHGLHESTKFPNPAIPKLENIILKYGSFDNYYKKCQINCQVKAKKEIYISAEGLLWPCCWLSGEYVYNLNKSQFIENKEKLNTKKYSIKEIIDSGFLRTIEESWYNDNRSVTCARQCGHELDYPRIQRK